MFTHQIQLPLVYAQSIMLFDIYIYIMLFDKYIYMFQFIFVTNLLICHARGVINQHMIYTIVFNHPLSYMRWLKTMVCIIMSMQVVENEVVMVRTWGKEGYNALQVGAINHPKLKRVHIPHMHTHTQSHTIARLHTRTHSC